MQFKGMNRLKMGSGRVGGLNLKRNTKVCFTENYEDQYCGNVNREHCFNKKYEGLFEKKILISVLNLKAMKFNLTGNNKGCFDAEYNDWCHGV